MIPILTFIGWHDSGKTTIIREIVKRLHHKGYKIAVIKSSKHRELNLDSPGSDSYLYRDDGIESVAILCPGNLILFQDNHGEDLKSLALRLFPDADMVIGEGFKHISEIPKIEVTRSGVSKEPLHGPINNVIAVVSDYEVSFDKVFKINQYTKLADFIENNFLKAEKKEINLTINGREIPLNKFVCDSLKGIILGFINCLKFTHNAQKVDIRIRI
jgi:molybdopterin-guanine dinucleotide biosynthesis protein B